jgi:DNA-binding transcriptional LysR family regulator
LDLFTSMRYFIRVYDSNSFSAAAKSLEVGQPALSKTIARLERDLGAPLFLRSTRQLTPTEPGRVFYEHAVKVVEDAEAALSAFRGKSQNFSGLITISGTLTFMCQYIIPKLPIFLEAHPGIDISVHLDDRNVGLIEQGIDVALRMGRLDDSNLVAKRIGRCRRIVVGAVSYLDAHREPQTPEELVEHTNVVFAQGEGGDRFTFKGPHGAKTISVRPKLRINATEGVRSAVLAGAGLSVATEWMFEAELDSGVVREVLTDWTLPDLDLWAVMSAGRGTSAKVRAFVEFIEAQVNSTRFGVGLNSSKE